MGGKGLRPNIGSAIISINVSDDALVIPLMVVPTTPRRQVGRQVVHYSASKPRSSRGAVGGCGSSLPPFADARRAGRTRIWQAAMGRRIVGRQACVSR